MNTRSCRTDPSPATPARSPTGAARFLSAFLLMLLVLPGAARAARRQPLAAEAGPAASAPGPASVTGAQLDRQLAAAARNCAKSTGSTCDEVVLGYIEVSFSACSAVGEGGAQPPDGPTAGQCIEQLECFNSGGQFVDGMCAFGGCPATSDVFCGADRACPAIGDAPQACVPFANSCPSAEACNERPGVGPGNTVAPGANASRETALSRCTTDACS